MVVISDLLCDLDAFYKGLGRMQHQGHDILIFHVLDKEEIELPFTDSVLFNDIEGTEELFAEPWAFRKAYKAAMEEFIADVGARCRTAGIDYVQMTTSDDLGAAMSKFLHQRQSVAGRHSGKITTSSHEHSAAHGADDATPPPGGTP